MNLNIKKVRKTKKRKKRKSTRKKVFKPVAPRRSGPKISIEPEVPPTRMVSMAEFTNRLDDTSTIFVCVSPLAALQKALHHVTTEASFGGLRDMTQTEADQFLSFVRSRNFEGALQLWNETQARKGGMGGPWSSVEIWSAIIHDEETDGSLTRLAEKSWQQRIATQSEAMA